MILAGLTLGFAIVGYVFLAGLTAYVLILYLE